MNNSTVNPAFTFLRTIQNANVLDSFVKAEGVISHHKQVLCCVSGGSDSDIVLDLLHRLGVENVTYVWFNTGMEYHATKEHLTELEKKYGIEIKREDSVKPIPTCCHEYGLPFLSKYISDMIERLQHHNFQWEDEPFDVLIKRYPNCKTALQWWTDTYYDKNGSVLKNSHFSVKRNRYLKEFLLEYPPDFPISNKCCLYAKKKASERIERMISYDLKITGIRKAEGGIRSDAYKSCFSSSNDNRIDNYRPLFWYTNDDKDYYCKHFGVTHSRCYTDYGMKRTGCAGCPFNRHWAEELKTIAQYEPKLYNACTNIFKQSYEYTRRYREYAIRKKYEQAGWYELLA